MPGCSAWKPPFPAKVTPLLTNNTMEGEISEDTDGMAKWLRTRLMQAYAEHFERAFVRFDAWAL